MTDSDELLYKADALLARWRSGSVAPRPPEDFPVLTEIVAAPVTNVDAPLPEIPTLTEVARPGAADPANSVARTNTTKPAASATNAIEAPAPDAPPAPAVTASIATELALSSPLDASPARADVDAETLDERVRLRVLDAIEPYVASFIEESIRLQIQELAPRLAASVAEDARRDILALVREAVRSAVAHELESRRDERSGSR